MILFEIAEQAEVQLLDQCDSSYYPNRENTQKMYSSTTRIFPLEAQNSSFDYPHKRSPIILNVIVCKHCQI